MSEKKRILVVDDEQNIRRILQAAFDKNGWHALVAENGEQALEVIAEQPVDCVLTDGTMPGMSGYDLQHALNQSHPDLPLILMTAYGTIPQAVEAIRNGAFEYVTKPFDLEHLKRVVKAALEQTKETPAPNARQAPAGKAKGFIAESPQMKEILETIEQVADSRATVLIGGESGTGKEVVAKLLHRLSPRQSESFVAVSCAALPETLLESELFGYEKGAFTGADGDKKGRFEMAHGGTLFLDEIGDIPMPTQVKLLRVLQEREFERLGATKPTQVDVRLITATNRDLQAAVNEGDFRLDLLYRLQVVEIDLPPLRERQEDILPLARHFLAKSSKENARHLSEVSEEALDALRSYSWPGNIRELENVMERAVVLAKREETELLPRHLPKALKLAA
jgi:DNA-binding NtrC family response regulator